MPVRRAWQGRSYFSRRPIIGATLESEGNLLRYNTFL
jgi:hypothetical protein